MCLIQKKNKIKNNTNFVKKGKIIQLWYLILIILFLIVLLLELISLISQRIKIAKIKQPEICYWIIIKWIQKRIY